MLQVQETQAAAEMKGSTLEDFLADARERKRQAEDADHYWRSKAPGWMRFEAGDGQWDEAIRAGRLRDGKPCLTVSRIKQFKRQITNDWRQNRSAMRVSPVDSSGDVGTAEAMGGLIRSIEYDSSADIAYDTAMEFAVGIGKGFLRAVTDYESPTSFHQVLRIPLVDNPLSVFCDPEPEHADPMNIRWAFIVGRKPRKVTEREYPGATLSKSSDWATYSDAAKSGWLSEDSVLIAEYFYVEPIPKTLVMLSSGDTIIAEDLTQEQGEELFRQGVTLTNQTRRTYVPIVHWTKINGIEILERTIWPGYRIPIAPVIGDRQNVNGEIRYSGIIADSEDSQRMVNYLTSMQAEMIAMAPKAPYIMAEGQQAGHERQWESANRINRPYLLYRPVALGSQFAPPPMRQQLEPQIQAVSEALLQWNDNYKAQTGIFDASLGARSNETSGKAIFQRQKQGDRANLHYQDNMRRAQRHLGRILLDAIPVVYTGARTLRIIGEDRKEEIIHINEVFERAGKSVNYRFDIGRYDVVVDDGPSYDTKRQEAANVMVELTRAIPQAMGSALDLVVRNVDGPGMQQIADRLKKQLPAELQEDDEKPEIPPAVQQRLTEMGQLIDAQTAELNQIATKMKDAAEERESRERIELTKLRVQLAIKTAELQSKEQQLALTLEARALDKRLGLLDIEKPVSPEGAPGNTRLQMESGAPMAGVPPGPAAAPEIDPRALAALAEAQGAQGAGGFDPGVEADI